MEFRLAEINPAQGLTSAKVRDMGGEIYLHHEVIVANKDIVEAQLSERSDIVGSYQVVVVFAKKGAERMATTTERNKGQW
ncbi:MAG: SecDF P1 head subdomain-containing protein, partial [Blastocatellia bacterium]